MEVSLPEYVTRDYLEKLLRESGVALNINNGRCLIIEDALCHLATLCLSLMEEMDKKVAVVTGKAT